ncbi:diadenylate cyclase CdaA [Spirochaeta lutea]|uniref:diadenylate cyclase CdaA n=1 Tax=Spirochaeta lutea TaxID=1480694 RepID=UPI001EE73BED|nr:diadenylate cyclase CdaA [Spirochaeta lutea]
MRSILIPIIDISLLTLIFYKGYQIFLQTRAISLIRGVIFLVVLYGVAYLLQLRTLLWLLNMVAPSLLIGVAIIFQPELRKIFIRLGQGQLFHFRESDKPLQIESVLKAAGVLSDQRRGALVVFVRNVGQKNIIETGSRLDAELSPALLITIFGHDTPLHDGAAVVENGRIVAAGAFLPLSEQQDIRRSFGTRHRAALGLAEESDAVILVVSEESGAISLAYDSMLHYNLGIEEARSRLSELLNVDAVPEEAGDGGFDE